MRSRIDPTIAIVAMSAITLAAIVAAAIFAPESPSVIGHILTVVLPTITALLSLIRSESNADELSKLHTKTDEIKQEAVEAKSAAAVVNQVVTEQVAPAVETIAQDVQVLKQNGHGDKR